MKLRPCWVNGKLQLQALEVGRAERSYKVEGCSIPWPTDILKDNCVPNNSEVKTREDSLVSKMLSPN